MDFLLKKSFPHSGFFPMEWGSTGNDADKHSRLETTSTAMSTERATARSDVTQPSKPPPNSAVKSTGTIPPKRNVTEVKTKNESSSPEPDVDNSKISSTQSNVTALKTSSIENKGSPETSTEKITMSTEQSETESSPESTAGEVGKGAKTMDSLSQNTTLEKKISKDDKNQVTSGAPTASENSTAKNAQSNKKEPSEMTEGAKTMDSLSQNTTLEPKISKDDKNQVTSGTPTASENSAAKNVQSNKKEPSEMTKDASDKNFDQDEIKENMADKDGSTVEVLLWICSILVVGMVVLLLYKKRQTIQNYAMKCKIVSRNLWQESGSKVKYAKLTSVEDAIPTVKKSVQAKNHIY
ncbi:uncharacterized protein LOC112563023 isoform X2 [Pomacea canaliculata]|uniref:uncharacterized protein LOC112563023 isoform X2 n=1 Tax=Pomacea canaliculata TaxID=400727 RepID=UPI000D72D64E|nr:uncharacterized protein LOC112563023 isoform X2 [Pomacea canaliculata]